MTKIARESILIKRKRKTMKKIPLFLLSSLMLFSVTSCNQDNSYYQGKIYLTFGEYQRSSTSTVNQYTYDELSDKITKAKEDFILIISNYGCGCWTDFEPIVAQANYKFQLGMKHIDCEIISSSKNQFGLVLTPSNMPSIAFFHEGVLARQVIFGNESSNKIFKHYEDFESFLLENIVLPKAYRIEKEDIDYKMDQDEEFNLYIGRSGCDDCGYLNKTKIKDLAYNYESPINNPIYYFDIQKYRSDEKTYSDLKEEMGLTTKNNPILGYDLWGGVVPTLQRRQGHNITDMISIYNDVLNRDTGEVSSYFTSTRVNAMPFLVGTGDQYVLDGEILTPQEMYDWTEGGKFTFHQAIVDKYFETYIK